MIKVFGQLVDQHTRCSHYHGDLDIVALKCFACQKYYSCYLCHDEEEEHTFSAYPRSLTEDKVVLCGICQREMTIAEYQKTRHCSSCNHAFNPNCSIHYFIYFRE